MKIRFSKVGSDPEYVFGARTAGKGTRLVGANEVLSHGGRELLGMIGTDGHAEIGELRPPPSRSVIAHVHSIASLLAVLRDFTSFYFGAEPLDIYALPHKFGQPLGGHVHVSFSVVAPEWAYWMENGVFPGDGWVIGGTAQAPAGVIAALQAQYPLHPRDARCWPCPSTWARFMERFVLPVELMFQGTTRAGRLGTGYGTALDVRTTATKLSMAHFEYRAPSTWLVHPTLAYTYLALTKLVTINLEYLLAQDDGVAHDQPTRDLDEFLDQVASLPNSTVDLGGLPRALEFLSENSHKFWKNGGLVDYEAWRAILCEAPTAELAALDESQPDDPHELAPAAERMAQGPPPGQAARHLLPETEWRTTG